MTESLKAEVAKLLAGSAFVYAKVPTHSIETVVQLANMGFRLTDTQMTLERPLDRPWKADRSSAHVRLSRADDRTAVEFVGRESFRFSRFHLDPLVSKNIADEIKAQWVGNFFTGNRGNYLIVAEGKDGVGGFLQLLEQDSGRTINVDLIAVLEKYHGQGFASQMIEYAAKHCAGKAMNYKVSTQAANIPSLRLYEKMGFTMCQSLYIFHAHGRN